MKMTFKSYQFQHQARKKQLEYEAKYGVKFDAYHTGAGFRIVPVWTKATLLSPELANALLPYLTTEYQTLMSLARQSGMSLPDTVSAAKTLVTMRVAAHEITRMGAPCAVKKVR